MNQAIAGMLEKYELRSASDHVNALREIFQEIALCGLWRAKFHEKAAFYGGTALRVLYGLDRFSEDMDFSLLAPDERFDLAPYCRFIEDELSAWGFTVTVVESAFLKANTREQLLLIDAGDEVAAGIHGQRRLKIKIEVDTDPPPGFSTETRFLLQPIPFSVKVYDPPSLFSGKMHALLCRDWKSRVKGRDWYDFVWYVGRRTELALTHLEVRMRQSGHYSEAAALDEPAFRSMLSRKISELDVADARSDVERFLSVPSAVSVWSREFFSAVAEKVLIQE
jgi:predicted nucleotidyltransferase component of viral defense system